MYESVRTQNNHQTGMQDYYSRLLTTAEAAAATGLSEYELRIGAKEGRYPVLWIGSPANKFRKMRWNLEVLNETIREQMVQRPVEN